MTFEELTQRLHTVMDAHKINRKKDLRFLAEIAWVLGVEVGFKLKEKEPPQPEPLCVRDLELSARCANTLGWDSPVSIIREVLDDDQHPLRKKLRVRDVREMKEIRENLGLMGVEV